MVPNRVLLGVDMELRDRSYHATRKVQQSMAISPSAARAEAPLRGEDDKGPLGPRSLACFHAAIVLYYVFVNYKMFTCSRRLKDSNHPITRMFLKGVTQFFTDWTQVIHQTYFVASLIQDILVLTGRHPKVCQTLATCRQRLFGPVLLPATCLTVTNFWACYAVAPHLMLGDLVALYPRIMNHAMHTFIAPIAYAELLVTRHHVVPRSQGLVSATIFMSGYASWMYLISYLTDLWPYRFLVVMSVPQHFIFIPCMHLHGYFWFFVNEVLISFVWGTKKECKQDTQE
ncbi:hypothetical protein B566_EDAN011371 [Ephemera danica]|nr:hypothetical protein B566_EDAN011371 [Ephemera danica]